MKILLGGIPLGCDNIGDEAIIACVVKMLKESIPGVELTVATADPSTAANLGVNVVPVFGFLDVGFCGFADEVRRHDAYVWCGATGLSDYPHVALELVEIAQRECVPTFVWGVGMDDELNPVFFKAAGKRRALLRLFGLVGAYERFLRARLARRLARVLPRCRGVWVRDPQSAAKLASMGFPNAGVAADTAILLDSPHEPRTTNHEPRTLGLCISTQRQVADLDGVRRLIDAVRAADARVLGIPMNVKTDRALLERLGVECIPGTTPEAVMAAAAECDVVLSSRLHLLILAANAGTPGLGIARGSKLANWLSNFGQTVVGSVYDCNWDKVTEQVLAAFKGWGEPSRRAADDWPSIRAAAYERLTNRLEKARTELIARLTS
jgi:polysaccharide pyruvyl transferase WcaK-like protein